MNYINAKNLDFSFNIDSLKWIESHLNPGTLQKLLFIFLYFGCSPYLIAQINPVEKFGPLFHQVQMSDIFGDSKTFPDCIPLLSPDKIMEDYELKKDRENFNLKSFVFQHFRLPENHSVVFHTNPENGIDEHIDTLWHVLTRNADSIKNSSLIPLPFPYVVPGGRFREIYYWDSYFTMLGLLRNNKESLAEDMLKNFAHLIDQYGHIPNGNRTYYLSRSQPPFFSLMVDLMAKKKGESYYSKYLPQLIKEYSFWMEGVGSLDSKNAFLRVVKMPDGEVLNRYWDNLATPRPESYKEDLEMAHNSERPPEEVYRNIRAACESGWDFSSRWLSEPKNLASIRTTEIVPIDLNCLLYQLEKTLAKGFRLHGEEKKADLMEGQALKRKRAILKYFWDEESVFFMDYDHKNHKRTEYFTLAGAFPLFFEMVSPIQAKSIEHTIWEKFYARGGLLTTLIHSGQQWDAPNGWPPLQYITIAGLRKYNLNTLSGQISKRWLNLNTNVYAQTGKMMEKYNVSDPDVKAGGGEYPAQDGFGWTNGIFLILSK